MPRLDVYLLRSPRLKLREVSSRDTLALVLKVAQDAGWEVRSTVVTELDGDTLKQDEIAALVEPKPVGLDATFQAQLGPMTLPQLSNVLRHREVMRRASESDADLSLVLEDDVLRSAALPTLLPRFLQAVTRNAFKADIVFAGLPKTTPDGKVQPDSLTLKDASLDDVELLRFQSAFAVAPSKDSYFVTRAGAEAFWKDWAKVSFRANVQISWTIKAKALRAYFFTHNLFIDGSKFGQYSSACSPNGHLLYNADYMEVLQLLQQEKRSPAQLDQADAKLARLLETMPNPNVMHYRGLIAHLKGDHARAHALLLEAFDRGVTEGMMLNPQSDLMNNAINLCRLVQ